MTIETLPGLSMSAVVIPFKPRADHVASAVAPTDGAAQILEFPSLPHSLTAVDIAALEGLAPTLDGVWTCKILVNDDGDERAVFEGHHAPPLMFSVGRSSGRLRLFNVDGEAVFTFATMDETTTILSNAIGRRLVVG